MADKDFVKYIINKSMLVSLNQGSLNNSYLNFLD